MNLPECLDMGKMFVSKIKKNCSEDRTIAEFPFLFTLYGKKFSLSAKRLYF